MLVSEFGKELWERLDMAAFSFDISLNGFQIQGPDKELKKVAFAVDAAYETIDRAAEAGADLLVTHHGLFWGRPIAVTGPHYAKLKRAMDSGLSLFACHLPLDAHPVYGNNAQMCLTLGMAEFDPFALYKGKYIGFKGRLPFPMTIEEIARLLGFSGKEGAMALTFGKPMIETCGIVSGAGGDDVGAAIEEGLDLFITGVCPHEMYHLCKESGMNVLAGGHYLSEVFGVKALQKLAGKEFGLETVFIDAETGL